jgi:hypothetical protein
VALEGVFRAAPSAAGAAARGSVGGVAALGSRLARVASSIIVWNALTARVGKKERGQLYIPSPLVPVGGPSGTKGGGVFRDPT